LRTLLHAGVWAYVEGGMGAISDAIAASAREKGAQVRAQL
jgi:phytoene dehydrogenase-like protein